MIQLQVPYLWIVAIERYFCSDSVVVVFIAEDGRRLCVLTPYN